MRLTGLQENVDLMIKYIDDMFEDI